MSLAYTCGLDGDVTTASICTTDVARQASERIVRRAWGPRWSPDGSKLAFSRSRIDMGDAWVRDLASEDTLPLPGADPGLVTDRRWLMGTTGSGVPTSPSSVPTAPTSGYWDPAGTPPGRRTAGASPPVDR